MSHSYNYRSTFRILSHGRVGLFVSGLLASLVFPSLSLAAPTGGVVTSGSAAISSSGATTTITQSTNKASINWNSFSVAKSESVNFVQPNTSSITLNIVVGNEASVIEGSLRANGQVWLLNSNGVLFGKDARVNVSGLVASTMNMSDKNFVDGNYKFESTGSTASAVNMGSIDISNSGYAALLAKDVKNEGTITAVRGKVYLVGADEVSINLNGNSLVNLKVDKGILDALVENKGAVYADGGEIYLTTSSAEELLKGVVNNEGILEAKTLDDVGGKIILFAHGGTANISGSIDASAPNGGDGGFVETSGKNVKISDTLTVTTKSTNGKIGTWLIDPVDFTVAASGGDMTGAAVSTALATNNFTIQSSNGSSGTNGDININDSITWSSNVLTLNAYRNININADMTATGTGEIAFYYGQGVADGGTARYTVADGVKILITDADYFTWKKGSAGTINGLVFQNEYLRFGDGTQRSLTLDGMLEQPYYKSSNGNWNELTYSYPLDTMIGVGGASYGAGTLYATADHSFSLNNAIDIAKYFEKTGSLTVSGTLSTTAGDVLISHNYELTSNTNYLKTTSTIKNNAASDIANVRFWIGTQDDNVAGEDATYKTRGNYDANTKSFTAATNQSSDVTNAVIVSNQALGTTGGVGVQFYSTNSGVNTIVANRYGWENIANANPTAQTFSQTTASDGAYALYYNAGTLTANASQSITWYYVAAPTNQISGQTQTQTQTPTPTKTVDLTQTIAPIANNIAVASVVPNLVLNTPTIKQEMKFVSNDITKYLISAPGGESTTKVSAKEVKELLGQPNELRVPLSSLNSTVELVNGGVMLPNGVEQEFYIADVRR